MPSPQEVVCDKVRTPTKSKGPRWGCRHTQACLWSLAIIVSISTRTNFSIAIVAMTDNTTSSNPDIPTYDWNNISVILSSFFWSYIALQIPAGHLSKTYGPKYFLLIGLFVNFGAAGFIPKAASLLGYKGVMLCRIIQGFSEGFLYPCVQDLMGTWCPENERATLSSYVFAGVNMGTIFGSLMTGYVSASWYGWPLSFYILSVSGIGWCVLWALFGQNSPASHPGISAEEKYYIQNSLKQIDEADVPTPWRKILTCVPVYALVAGFIGNIWGYAILMTETPTFMAKIMNFDVKSNGTIVSIPPLFGIICSLFLGPLSDWLITHQYLSTLNTRRLFQLLSAYGQGLCLVWLAFINPTHGYLSVFVLTLCQSLNSCTLVGTHVNHLDLSPRFGGVLYSILNVFGLTTSIMAPLSAQLIITDMTDQFQWRTMFLIATVFYFVGGTLFSVFASADRQEWDGPAEKEIVGKKRLSIISFPGV